MLSRKLGVEYARSASRAVGSADLEGEGRGLVDDLPCGREITLTCARGSSDLQGLDHAHGVAHALVVVVGSLSLRDHDLERKEGLSQPAMMFQALVGMLSQDGDDLGVDGR